MLGTAIEDERRDILNNDVVSPCLELLAQDLIELWTIFGDNVEIILKRSTGLDKNDKTRDTLALINRRIAID